MAHPMTEKARRFLGLKRFAVVGVSRSDSDFSRAVLRELWRQGYDAVPVGATVAEVDGRRCFARLSEITPPVTAALLLTPPARTDEAVRDCIAAGVRSVWMHRGGGSGAATPQAVALCQAAGIEAVIGLCPFMVMPASAWPHRLHGLARRLTT